MLLQLDASSFAKDRENVKGELCLNVRIEGYYSFLHHCLFVLRPRGVPKKYFEDTEMGEQAQAKGHKHGPMAPLCNGTG